MTPSRREFFAAGALAAAAPAPASAASPLPTVPFGSARVTRLIVGSNPLYGYSHFNQILDRHMRDWMTAERRRETVQRALAAGVNTWQTHWSALSMEDCDALRGAHPALNWFLLGMRELHRSPALLAEAARRKPIGIAHHGNMTDDLFREGRSHEVREFTKRVRQTGVLVGVSAHNPRVIETIEEQDWDVDYYMTCFYQVSRTREEIRALCNGEAPLGETYLERDPERMASVIRMTKKPCLAFKILGAGRAGFSAEQVERAIRFAFAHIKPSDAVIVGMYPRFKDEPEENAAIVRRLLTGGGAPPATS